MWLLMLTLAQLHASSAAVAQAEPNLAVNGDFAGGLAGWNVPQDETCAPAVVESNIKEYAKALRLAVKPRAGSQAWSIILYQPVNAFLDAGDRLALRFWARSPESLKVSAYVETPQQPYTKSPGETFTLTPEWKEYELQGKAVQDFSGGEARLGFHLGFGAGTIELTGIRLQDLDAKAGVGGERPTVDKPLSLIANGDFTQGLDGNWGRGDGQKLKVSVLDAEVGGYTKAVRLESNPEPGRPPWEVQFGQRCTGYVMQNDAVYFRAWLRSPDRCRVSFIYEMSDAPNTKSIDQVVRLTPEWREYRFLGRARPGFRPGQSQAKLFLGYDQGAVEVAGVRVEDYGEAAGHLFEQTIDYWAGREHPDTWRQPALDRIEQIRKGDLTVKVVDAAGKPVPGAQVHIEQKRHFFRFGTAAPAGRLADTQNPDNLRFQQEVARLFNTVTFENDLKWAAMSDATWPTADRAAAWLKAHDIDLRGHCLLWGSYQHLAPAFRELRGADLLQACHSHVTDYATRMKGQLYLWDVVNEAGSNTELWDSIGWEAFADAFRWAREADPNVRLCYNDYGIINENPGYRATVAKRIQYLLDHQAPCDPLGIQGHMSVPLTPIDRVLEILDEWAAFGKDLEITEFDLGCPDDQVHAQYVRDCLIAAFSHPRVTGFIEWGFWEGSHWRARDGGAMFRLDWSKRPAQEAWEDLVLKQWWTNWQGTANAEGVATTRAFYGRHEVTVEANGKRATATIELVPGGKGEAEVRVR